MPTKPPIFRPPHQPAPTPERRGTAAARGYDAAYRRLRELVLAEEPICRFADDPRHKDECTLAATVCDHIIPITAGGPALSRENCRGVCRIAHDRLTTNYRLTGKNELPPGEQE